MSCKYNACSMRCEGDRERRNDKKGVRKGPVLRQEVQRWGSEGALSWEDHCLVEKSLLEG